MKTISGIPRGFLAVIRSAVSISFPRAASFAIFSLIGLRGHNGGSVEGHKNYDIYGRNESVCILSHWNTFSPLTFFLFPPTPFFVENIFVFLGFFRA